MAHPTQGALAIEQSVARPAVTAARRIVLKVGTRVLTQPDGHLAMVRVFQVVEAIAALRRRGREVMLVTSGAVGLGRAALGLASSPKDLALRQACAAIGQSRLMAIYQDAFAHLGLLSAQILLTEGDFGERTRYVHLRRTLSRLLHRGVVPIINENDVVSASEIALLPGGKGRAVFGDNDRLSALVASELDCDLLVLLTDVPGVFERDPRVDPAAALLHTVADPEALRAEVVGSSSGVGRGGMRSKVDAAFVASRSGCHAVIASGMDGQALPRVLAGEEVGTWFPSRGSLSARRRWIAFATRSRGTVHLDAGATAAITQRRACLLAAGVTAVEGDFKGGDVVELRGPSGERVGRGVIKFDADVVARWVGKAPAGPGSRLIRRHDLVLEAQ